MNNLKNLLQSCYIFIFTGALLIWMHQSSLETYWQQSYHRPPPWHSLQTVALWQAGSRVHTATAQGWRGFWLEMRGQVVPTASAEPLEISERIVNTALTAALNITKQPKSDPSYLATTLEVDNDSADFISQPVIKQKQHATISAGERVFFAGDSMMQGVAPPLAARLRREYGLSSLDLSKQSTGLAYPSVFNWPATIKQTLEKKPDIKLLVLFLGPNDPWDMPSGKGGKYLRYASLDWEELYRSRIRDIISTAQSHNVDIIWVSAPNMRGKKLTGQVSYLNDLYESEVQQAGEIFLSGNQVFKYSEAIYSDYMGDGSHKQKIRADDGIHFTHAGRRALADALFDLIVYTPERQTEKDTQLATNTVE